MSPFAYSFPFLIRQVRRGSAKTPTFILSGCTIHGSINAHHAELLKESCFGT